MKKTVRFCHKNGKFRIEKNRNIKKNRNNEDIKVELKKKISGGNK